MKHFRPLEAFANLVDDPNTWTSFRASWPDFFPPSVLHAADSLVRLRQYRHRQAARDPEERSPLTFYRDCVRLVWTLNDPAGIALMYLLGFNSEAAEARAAGGQGSDFFVIKPQTVPGQAMTPDEQEKLALPPGRPVVNGVTGAIDWRFGCALQGAVYELMQERWRALVCPVCGRLFVATKTAAKYCSDRCANTMKKKRALDYFHRAGAARRAARLKALKQKKLK